MITCALELTCVYVLAATHFLLRNFSATRAIMSGSIGWDAPLPSAGSASDVAMSALDSFDAFEKTREVKVDANDYSRFKGIGDDAEDVSAGAKKESETAATDTCRNCHKPGAKLKCSVCKKAVYCARACQASDWTFHKRICKKPEAPKAPASRPSSAKATSTTSAGTSSSTPTPTTSSSNTTKPPVAKKPAKSSTEVVRDEPDLASDMRGYKNGLPYFHRELSHDEKQLIGDIAPQKIDAPPAPVRVRV